MLPGTSPSQGKTQTTSAHAATESEPVDEPSAEMVAAQAAYEESSKKTDFSKKMDSVWEYLKKLFRLSLDTKPPVVELYSAGYRLSDS